MGWQFDALLPPPFPVNEEVNGFILHEPYVRFCSEHVCRTNIVNNLNQLYKSTIYFEHKSIQMGTLSVTIPFEIRVGVIYSLVLE